MTFLWGNAVNDVRLVRQDKKKIIEILELNYAFSIDNPCKPHPYKENVILVSVVYSNDNTKDKIDLCKTCRKKLDIDKDNFFKETMVFSIQKNTYEKVINFLEDKLRRINNGKN